MAVVFASLLRGSLEERLVDMHRDLLGSVDMTIVPG